MSGLDLTEGSILAILAAAAGYGGRLLETILKGQPSRKDLIEVGKAMAVDLMNGMREDLDALRAEVKDLKASHAECEERCTALTGEVRALQSAKETVERLLAQLKDPAATGPGGELRNAIIEMSGGGVRDVSPRTPARRKTK